MKIAYVCNLIEPTGGDRILYHHAVGLRSLGHHVDVYATGYLEWCAEHSEDWNSPSVKDMVHIFDKNSDPSKMYSFKDYDIIIANGLYGANYASHIDHPNKAWFCQNLDKYIFGNDPAIDNVYKTYNKYLVYSHDLDRLIKHYYGPKNITICTNGIDYDSFKSYQKQEFFDYGRVCFMVAYYRNYKGIQFAKNVFTELKKRKIVTVEINATIGPLESTMEFYKNPSFSRKCEIISECDFMLHPSVFETWSLVCMESMALGTPVIGVNSKGVKEYATPDNSVIFEERNVDTLCNEIESLYNNRSRYLTLQKNGIKTAKDHDWKKIIVDIEKSYMELLK